MSTDPAHPLADSFDVEIGDSATPIAKNLWAEQIDAQNRLESNWREIQEYFIALMNWAGVETIQAEELSVIPGLDEIFSLIDVPNPPPKSTVGRAARPAGVSHLRGRASSYRLNL